MAGSALSFFTRLFSSKKKRILDKQNQEHVINNAVVYEREENNLQYQSPYDTKTQSQNLSGEENKKSDETVGKNNKVSSQIASNTPDKVYLSHEQHENFALHDDEDAGSVVSTEEIENISNEEALLTNSSYEESHESVDDSVIDNNRVSETLDQDDNLEYDSMVLLSKLEQIMIKLDDNTVQKSIPLVIEAMVETANHVIEFSEQLPIPEQKKILLQVLLDRDEKNYKILSSNYINNKLLEIKISTITENDNPQQTFIDLSNDLLRVINVYLSASVKAFRSNRISEQWKTLYTGFFVNLTKSVRSSQANQQT
jgi:hypothetical protein